jgi:hypothetical protein
MLNDRTVPFHDSDWKAEPFRPSSQSSICRAEITGTPLAWADAMMASDPSDPADGLKSVCMFAVNAP